VYYPHTLALIVLYCNYNSIFCWLNFHYNSNFYKLKFINFSTKFSLITHDTISMCLNTIWQQIICDGFEYVVHMALLVYFNHINMCIDNNMYHSKCNVCLVFSCFKVVIWFNVEIIRFVCIVVFLIYHGNMWINLKLIQRVKNKQKHTFNIVTLVFK